MIAKELSHSDWPFDSVRRAENHISNAAKEIRLFYFRQLLILRQFPYLALSADFVGCGTDELRRAYTHCVMKIPSTELFIELRGGQILFAGQSGWENAKDQEVYFSFAYLSTREFFSPQVEAGSLTQKIHRSISRTRQKEYQRERQKAEALFRLDHMMSELPLIAVLESLRNQGYNI